MKGAGLIIIFEVVQVHDIRRQFTGDGIRFQEILDSCGTAGAGAAGHEYVVSLAFDFESEMDRIHRSILTDNDVIGLYVSATVVFQEFRLATPAQLLRLQFSFVI
jgi:hypothetical protein